MKLLEKIHAKYHSTVSKMDPYTLTHPLTGERLTVLQHHIKASPASKCCFPAADEAKFQRIKAKLAGFIQDPGRVRRTYQGQVNIQAAYALAIADFKSGNYASALQKMDQLCQSHPKDPYFHELKGQILFESGQVTAAIPILRHAVKLRTKSPYIKLLLAHALMESPEGGMNREAIDLMVPITRQQPDNAMVWRLLASAYGKVGNMGMAALSLAEEAFLKKEYKLAEGQAKRAERLLSTDPKGQLRARDLMEQIKNIKNKEGILRF
jgi:predicted Zn-dependent protease